MEYEKIIIQWQEFEILDFIKRDYNMNIDHNFITTLTGARRVGKTYLCFQKIKELYDQGISKNNILYINFEDEKIFGAEAKDLEKLLETFYELTELNKKQKIYLFLDEIQVVKNWEVWVRKTHDLYQNIKLIITGSSSKLLSKEISTKLRGRVYNIEIYPLSFKEYLQWNNIVYNLKTISHSKKKIEIKKKYLKYLVEGGYPAVHTNQTISSNTILQNYYNSMIFKDVIERYKIKEIKKLQILAKLLFESTSKEISYNKLANKMNSLGFKISKNTIIEYISYFEDTYLFFQNIKYEYSLTKQLGSIKKVYCLDNGLLNAVSFSFSENKGKLMENLVFVELKRNNQEIYYYKKEKECDFLINKKNKIIEAIQVTEQLNELNYDREINGLLEAMNKHKLKEGTIITTDLEDKKIIKNKIIHFIPLWKWLLTN